ncbi:MAG: M23 family metallopeptidase [Candidatus Levyibacteriota bacterium]
MTKIANALKGIRSLTEIKENPIDFFIDLLISAIISIFVPLPFVGAAVAKYKKQILLLLGGLLLLIIVVPFVVLQLFLTTYNQQQTTQTVMQGLHGTQLLQALQGYREEGITETAIPFRNPLGGNGMTNSRITMDYHDPRYTYFDGIHTGIDLVPTNAYLTTNKAYLKTGEIIVFATMNGTGKYFVDQYGANTVDVYNSENTLFTRYIHLKTSFISTGQTVEAGQPIGIMVETGMADGVHLHYEIRVKDAGSFVTVDPKQYIQ